MKHFLFRIWTGVFPSTRRSGVPVNEDLQWLADELISIEQEIFEFKSVLNSAAKMTGPTGPRGFEGPTGPRGSDGLSGKEGPMGNSIEIVPWEQGRTYFPYQLVGLNGAVYYTRTMTTTPPPLSPWQLLLCSGTVGLQGRTGAAGADGADGADGGAICIFNFQIGTTYLLELLDVGKTVVLTNALPIAVTIPTNAVVPFPVGTRIDFLRGSVGKVTFSGIGVTIKSKSGNTSIAAANVAVTLIQDSIDNWYLIGDLIA